MLDVDAEYRKKASAGKLKKIAPRLLNPERKAWLPIMVKESAGYKFTVMIPNTATAHKLGKTEDWVVVYFEKGKGENQCTIVTEGRGPLKGKRVIRGKNELSVPFRAVDKLLWTYLESHPSHEVICSVLPCWCVQSYTVV